MTPRSDAEYVQIVDAALADAATRSGKWLVCRPGCDACCHGVFAISSLDAQRLQQGLGELRQIDPERASRLMMRVNEAITRIHDGYPGDPETGVLGEDAESKERFADFANDEPCPVLDPATGTCDLYSHRPITCRVFGPPVRSQEGLGVCELCFRGAPEEEIARCEMKLPQPGAEESLTHPLGDWTTVVAYALQMKTVRPSF